MRFTSVAIMSMMLASTQAVELTQQSSLALSAPMHHKKHAGQHKHHAKRAHRAADHKKSLVAAPHRDLNADDIGAAGDSKVATVTADTDRVNAGADAADSADFANAADKGAVEETPKPKATVPPTATEKPVPVVSKKTAKPVPAKKAAAVKPKKPVNKKVAEVKAAPVKKITPIANGKVPKVDSKKPNFAKKGEEAEEQAPVQDQTAENQEAAPAEQQDEPKDMADTPMPEDKDDQSPMPKVEGAAAEEKQVKPAQSLAKIN